MLWRENACKWVNKWSKEEWPLLNIDYIISGLEREKLSLKLTNISSDSWQACARFPSYPISLFPGYIPPLYVSILASTLHAPSKGISPLLFIPPPHYSNYQVDSSSLWGWARRDLSLLVGIQLSPGVSEAVTSILKPDCVTSRFNQSQPVQLSLLLTPSCLL